MPRFDKKALFQELDRKRQTLNISWAQVARAIGVAEGTVIRLNKAGPMEADGVLAMVQWTNRPPEDFIVGSWRGGTKRLSAHKRINVRLLHAALERRRRRRAMSWKEVAAEIGDVTPAMLTRLATGKRIGIDTLIAMVGWLESTIESFRRPAK